MTFALSIALHRALQGWRVLPDTRTGLVYAALLEVEREHRQGRRGAVVYVQVQT